MRGDETGEKAGSQPSGISSGMRARSRDAAARETASTAASGSRSPLNSWLTVYGALKRPAPAVGSALRNGTMPTISKASDMTPSAPAVRTNTSLTIGLLRSLTNAVIDQMHQRPPSRALHRLINVQDVGRFQITPVTDS